LLEALHKELAGRVFMATTVFNAWATLRRLVTPRTKPPGPPSLTAKQDDASQTLSAFLAEDRQAVARALQVVAASLARFVRRCLAAGADGIFLSVRDDWVDTPANGSGTYDQLVRPTDLVILEAASAARFNLLHVCGRALNFAAFADYPVQVINWADRSAGPSIAAVRDRVKPALCAGVDNLETLVNGTPEQCAEQVREAIAQACDHPFLIGPGCTYDPQRVPHTNLDAIHAAARDA
jgi:uroporphyrinogen-III decarboxylase